MNLRCHCLHKSGSMFLYRLFKKIAEDNNIDYYSIHDNPQDMSEWNTKLIIVLHVH